MPMIPSTRNKRRTKKARVSLIFNIASPSIKYAF
jgi:hypothetical protein